MKKEIALKRTIEKLKKLQSDQNVLVSIESGYTSWSSADENNGVKVGKIKKRYTERDYGLLRTSPYCLFVMSSSVGCCLTTLEQMLGDS